jgi:hypothetical protein
MKTYGGEDILLTSALDDGDWIASPAGQMVSRYPLARKMDVAQG